jgi:peptide/nickel transport system substrate-binding protein
MRKPAGPKVDSRSENTRNLPAYRDPGDLIDHLKRSTDGDLEGRDRQLILESGAQGLCRLNFTGNAVDDPDQGFYENYACGSSATTRITVTRT